MTPQCFPSNDLKPLGKVAGLAPIFTDAPNITKENIKKNYKPWKFCDFNYTVLGSSALCVYLFLAS